VAEISDKGIMPSTPPPSGSLPYKKQLESDTLAIRLAQLHCLPDAAPSAPPPYLSDRQWVVLCAQELSELLRLDRLRGGANAEEIKAKMKGSVALFGWQRTYEDLRVKRRSLEAMLRDDVQRTGNVWNVPGYKMSSVDMDPLDAEARKRAAAELREWGEDEAAFFAEYPT
jgi:hypothetical protein